MVVAQSESGKTLGHEVGETEGLFRLHCHRCRKDVAHNLPNPNIDATAKREAIREHQKSCRATLIEFSIAQQTYSRLE